MEIEMASLKGYAEKLWQPYYDSAAVAAGPVAAGTIYRLFQNPVGTAGQTFLTTNMELAGQVPKGFNLRVMYIVAEYVYKNAPVPATDIADWIHWSSRILFELNVISKTVFRIPLQQLTSGSGVSGLGAGGAANNDFYISAGIPDPRAKYSLKPQDIIIEDQQNFDVTLSAVRGTAVDVATDFECRIYLDGVLERPVQ